MNFELIFFPGDLDQASHQLCPNVSWPEDTGSMRSSESSMLRGLSAISAEETHSDDSLLKTTGEGKPAAVTLAWHIPTGEATAVKTIEETQQNLPETFLQSTFMKAGSFQHTEIFEVMEAEGMLCLIRKDTSQGDIFERKKRG